MPKVIEIRKLAAVDMAWLGRRLILTEYALGVILPLALGALSSVPASPSQGCPGRRSRAFGSSQLRSITSHCSSLPDRSPEPALYRKKENLKWHTPGATGSSRLSSWSRFSSWFFPYFRSVAATTRQARKPSI